MKKENKEHYTRVSDSIRRNKNLTSAQKLILGYLQSYQSTPDGAPSKKFYYDKQDKLAEELGMSLKALNVALKCLEEKKLIFKTTQRSVDKKQRQYKNRKGIIFVDEFNPYPEEAITETISTQHIQDVVEELIVSENEDMEESESFKEWLIELEEKKLSKYKNKLETT